MDAVWQWIKGLQHDPIMLLLICYFLVILPLQKKVWALQQVVNELYSIVRPNPDYYP